MNFQIISNIAIRGTSAAVPPMRIDNLNDPVFQNSEAAEKFVSATGIRFRHSVANSGLCTSDLCLGSATELLGTLGWPKETVDALVFVTQTPDYQLPATSCILQDRLGLKKNLIALDVSLGCSGWVYGLMVLSSLMQSGCIKRGLLLAGDTPTLTKSASDPSTWPLFGDAGTATALEFSEGAPNLVFDYGTDGSGHESIIIPGGGYRHPVITDSLVDKEISPGVFRNDLQSRLDGAKVFTFGISTAPKSIRQLMEFVGKQPEQIDYLLLHQANKMMTEKIRSKLGFSERQTPYSLAEFGNTSSASIPLTMVTELRSELMSKSVSLIASGFGVGLSWASVYLETENLAVPNLVAV